MTDAAFQGLRTCYIALAGKRKLHVEWSLLATSALIDRAQLANLLLELAHPPVRAFGLLVLSYLEKPMPTPAGIAEVIGPTHKSISDSVDGIDLVRDISNTHTSPDFTAANDARETEKSETAQPKFQRGDSVIGWHIKRASNASRNDRLALESWTSLSIAQTCQTASRLPALLSDANSPWHLAAVIATASLLTSTPG
jgi:hypothetical protein